MKICTLPIGRDSRGYLWTACFHFSVALDQANIGVDKNLKDYLTDWGQDCDLEKLLIHNTFLDMLSFWTNKIVIGNRVDRYCMKPEEDRSETIIMRYLWDPERQAVWFNLSATINKRIAELVERGT